MMRLLDIATTANSNLLRSKLRTFLTMLAIGIGTFTLAISLGLGQGLRHYIASQLGQYKDVNLYQVTKAGTNSFSRGFGSGEPEEYSPDKATAVGSFSETFFSKSDIEAIKSTVGVKTIRLPYSATFLYATGSNGKKYIAQNSTFNAQIGMSMVAGETLVEDGDAGKLLLSRKYVSVVGATKPVEAVGKSLNVSFKTQDGSTKTETFVVKGVYEPTLLDAPITLNQPDAERIAKLQTPYGDPQFYYLFATKADTVSDAQLKDNLTKVKFTARSFADINNTINGVIDGIQISLAVFSGIAILASVVGVINTLFMAVTERTREIGLFRALGAKRKTIFALFSVEAALLGFWGSVAGLVLAFIAQLGVNVVAANTFLKGIEGIELLKITPPLVAVIIVAMAIITLVAGLIPAFKASNKLDPIEALRYE